jgi:hypothetical protein
MARPSRRNPASRRPISRIRGLALRVTAVALLLAMAYGGYLAWTATSEFEGRRWDIPAQVYAAPLELYAGRALSAENLVAELKRLGYREDPRLVGPGTYRVGLGRISSHSSGPFRRPSPQYGPHSHIVVQPSYAPSSLSAPSSQSSKAPWTVPSPQNGTARHIGPQGFVVPGYA